jgi:hypothetical protein
MSELMTDVRIAQKYVSKANNARERGIEFNLPFTSFKNMMRAKKCQYTDIVLTDTGNQCATDRTIDRIDSRKGYVKGNVIAICHAANQFKGMFEGGSFSITTSAAKKIIELVETFQK